MSKTILNFKCIQMFFKMKFQIELIGDSVSYAIGSFRPL